MFEELHKLCDEFSVTDTPTANNSLPISQLLQKGTCQHFLHQVKETIQAPSLTVAASMFSKRYAYALVVPTLWMMSVYDKGLQIEIDNCHIEILYDEGRWMPHLRLEDWSYRTPTSERDRFREQVLTTLMRDHLAPVWNRLHIESKIPMVTLWENTASYIYWLYEQKIKQTFSVEMYNKTQEDYQYLLYGMDAQLFGEHVQPMHRFLAGVESADRQRKTCCLSYKVGGGRSCCRICPHRSRLDRQKQQQEVALT